MKLGGVEVHGALLVVALGGAYVSWTAEEDTAPADGKVALWDLGDGDVTGVRYETKGREVRLERKVLDGGAKAIWATTKRERPQTPKKKAADAAKKDEPAKADSPTPTPAPTPTPTPAPAAAAEPAAEAEPEPAKAEPDKAEAPKEEEKAPPPDWDIKEFRVNSRGGEVFDALRKPQARRSLGVPAADRLEDLKLADPEATIVVQSGAGERKLQVGMMAYGGGLRYVRDPASGTVFVVEAKLVDDLKWADSRLVERDLQPFKAQAVKEFSVEAGARKRSFVREGEAKQPAEAVWKDAAAPDGEPDTSAGTWLGKLFRLRADRYTREGEALHHLGDEASGQTVPEVTALSVTLKTDDGKQGSLRLTRFGEAKDARWYGRTQQTGVRVGLSRYLADEVARDIEGLLPSAE